MRPGKRRVVRRVCRHSYKRAGTPGLAIDRLRQFANVPTVLVEHPRSCAPEVDLGKRCFWSMLAHRGWASRIGGTAQREHAKRSARKPGHGMHCHGRVVLVCLRLLRQRSSTASSPRWTPTSVATFRMARRAPSAYGRALLPDSCRIVSFWSGIPKIISALIT